MSPTWLSWKTENSRWSPCLERPQLWEMTFELGPKGRKGLVIPRPGKGQCKEDEGAARGGPDAGMFEGFSVESRWRDCTGKVELREESTWLWTLGLAVDRCYPLPL